MNDQLPRQLTELLLDHAEQMQDRTSLHVGTMLAIVEDGCDDWSFEDACYQRPDDPDD